MGEPLGKFRFFPSVSGTDTMSTKEIKYKNISVGEPLEIFTFVISSCAAFVGFPKEAKSG